MIPSDHIDSPADFAFARQHFAPMSEIYRPRYPKNLETFSKRRNLESLEFRDQRATRTILHILKPRDVPTARNFRIAREHSRGQRKQNRSLGSITFASNVKQRRLARASTILVKRNKSRWRELVAAGVNRYIRHVDVDGSIRSAIAEAAAKKRVAGVATVMFFARGWAVLLFMVALPKAAVRTVSAWEMPRARLKYV